MKSTVLSQEALAKLAAMAQTSAPESPEGELPTAPSVEAADELVGAKAALAEKDVKISELEGAVEGMKVAMASASTDFEVKLAEVTTKLDTFKGIVGGQVKSMRMALSLAEVDISAMNPDAVLTEYKATSELFVKSLPTGGLVKSEEKTVVQAIETSVDASKIKALGFK